LASRVEALDGMDQAEGADLNQVVHVNAVNQMLSHALGNVPDHRLIRLNEPVAGGLRTRLLILGDQANSFLVRQLHRLTSSISTAAPRVFRSMRSSREDDFLASAYCFSVSCSLLRR